MISGCKRKFCSDFVDLCFLGFFFQFYHAAGWFYLFILRYDHEFMILYHAINKKGQMLILILINNNNNFTNAVCGFWSLKSTGFVSRGWYTQFTDASVNALITIVC